MTEPDNMIPCVPVADVLRSKAESLPEGQCPGDGQEDDDDYGEEE